MIPIWRGGTLSLIARLGFRVRFSPFSDFLTHKTNRIHYPMLLLRLGPH